MIEKRILVSRRYDSAPLIFFFLISLHGIRATRPGEIVTMADLSSALPSASEVMKSEVNKALIAPQLNTPHSVGLHVPLKLTREKFLLWKTQLFPLLNFHGLAHVLTQDPLISSHLDDRGEIVINTAYQTWWRQDQQVLSLIVSSLSEAVLPCVIGKLTKKEAWSALIKHCSSLIHPGSCTYIIAFTILRKDLGPSLILCKKF